MASTFLSHCRMCDDDAQYARDESAERRWKDELGAITEDAYYHHVGYWIRKRRQTRGMSQFDLSIELDLGTSVTVHKWEANKVRPSAYMIDKLERFFGARVRP